MSYSAKLYNKNYRAYEKKSFRNEPLKPMQLCIKSPKSNNFYPQEKTWTTQRAQCGYMLLHGILKMHKNNSVEMPACRC